MEYKDLTNVEIATIVVHSITFNCEKARRMFQEENDKEPPPARTLRHWNDRFMETLCHFILAPMPVTSPFAACLMRIKTKSLLRLQMNQLHHNVKLRNKAKCHQPAWIPSWKKTASDLGSSSLSKNSNQTILLSAKLDILERHRSDRNFVMNINFSVEATFHGNCSVNKHNMFIYDNPHAVAPQPMKSPSVTC